MKASQMKNMGQKSTIGVDQAPEARIVDEDQTRAVIALSIDKAWLARNIRFLAALADCATTCDLTPAPARSSCLAAAGSCAFQRPNDA